MSPRYEYRPETLALEVSSVARDPAQRETLSYNVVGRNISREGAGLLAGQFIYPRSPCRLRLSSPFGGTQTVDGFVARCRYVIGSGSLYEVGVEFDSPIDVSLFVPRARRVPVLLVGADAATEELISGFLSTENALLRCVSTGTDAADAAAANGVDLVLIDLDQSSAACSDGLALMRRLRGEGYVGPVLGMTAQVSPELRELCEAAGGTGYLIKPIFREQLRGLVRSLADQPLVSALAGDPAMVPLIDRFVAGLRGKVGEMSRANQCGDMTALARIVRDIRAQAGSYGFETISDEATLVQVLIDLHGSGPEVHRALHRLLDVCLRARPASSPADTDTPAADGYRRT